MHGNYTTKIFIAEDDKTYGKLIQLAFEKESNFDVHLFHSGNEFINHLSEKPDIVVLDYNLPDLNGLELLQRVMIADRDILPVILSGQEEVKVVVEAYKHGAKDYIIKSKNAIPELINSVNNLSSNVKLRKEVEDLRGRILDRAKYTKIYGESKAILSVLRLVQKIEQKDVMVLVTGESGTGKEVIAKAIHYNSHRKKRAFIPINMGAIPEDLAESELFGHEKGAFTGANSRRYGAFEEAKGGTIFLDEIGEINLNLQVKLLRVLQEKKITRVGSNKEIQLDVRVVAATNKNLMELVKQGKFREDLYYRLQGFPIHLPPLRNRGNDILILAKRFLDEFCSSNHIQCKNISRSAARAMLEYKWAGNVRELKSVVERAVLMSESNLIEEEDLMFTTEMAF